MHATDLPPPQHFAGDTVIEVLLPRSNRDFVEVAEHEGMADVLKTHTLFGFQIIRVLGSEHSGVTTSEKRERGVRIGQRLGVRVGSQEVYSISKAPLQLGLKRVVG